MVKKKKTDLAAGLGALIGGGEPIEAVTITSIPISQIEVNPWQPRNEFAADALKELAESIKIHGLIQPITVRRLAAGQYQLISGERRLRASKIAELTSVPAYIRLADDQEMLEMALVENIQREELNPIEVALTYHRLKEECGLTDIKLGERVAKDRTTVTNMLRLLKLPPEIQNSLKSKVISVGHAKILVGIDDVAFQLAVHKEVIQKHLSVHDTTELAKNRPNPKAPPVKKKSAIEPSLRPVVDSLNAFFGSKIQFKRKPTGAGQIVVNFKNDDDLNRILDLIDDKK